MQYFDIEGGVPLKGEITLSGNKNEALPIIAATLLTDKPITLRNVPEIADVHIMLDVVRELGGSVEQVEKHQYLIENKNITKTELPYDLCKRIRASILFAGPMLARKGLVKLPPPGGDVIGRRRLDTHFLSFQALGARVEIGLDYSIYGDRLQGTSLFLDEASVTGTENLIMLASLTKGTTEIFNAACEPHVQGLCHFLNSMGAQISGIGTNKLIIDGVDALDGTDYVIGADILEAGSIIGLSAVTNSEIVIKDAPMEHMRVILQVFKRLGVETFNYGSDIYVPRDQELAVHYDFHGDIPKIDDAPWPQFPTDLMSIAIVVATQARGTVLFFEKMFEGRMFFVDNLISMGARIIMCDPHRVVVVGPSPLYGTRLESPDIRAGMALLIASLSAKGRSRIYNVGQIDRGYERIEEKLQSVGARIERRHS